MNCIRESRSTIHAIFNRLGADALVGRMSRVREDERFKLIGPEDMIMPYRLPTIHTHPGTQHETHDDVEIWFDWPFVDFWKSNYCECRSVNFQCHASARIER